MTIKLRGSKFQADVTYKGKRYRALFGTRNEAEAWELQAKANLAAGKEVNGERELPRDMKSLTMYTLMQMTAEKYWIGTKGEKTSLINANTVVNYFGEKTQPSSIDELKIHEFTMQLRKAGLAGSTINSKLAALSKMLRLAKTLKAVDEKPEIERVKNARGRETFVSEEREVKLLAQLMLMGAGDIHDLVIFLVDTGARTGEALKLQWTNCYADRVIFMDTKNGKNRVVPLTTRVREVLARQPKEDSGPFTRIKKNGRLRGMWERAKHQMKLDDDPEFVPHLLRHTFCSRLVQRGVPLTVVKELAGHSNIATTMRYSHLAPADAVQGIAALERPLTGSPLRVVS